MQTAGSSSVTYREVLAIREFRTLVVAQVLSVLGDQVSKVALTVLVYASTGSAALTGLAYAATFLPWVAGGPLLATLADRYPRRELLVGCDIGRGLIVGLMAVPHVPLPVLFLLLFVAELMAPPFDAARSALLPDVLEGDRLVVGGSLTQVVWQVAQIAGFGLGGTLVALFSAHGVFALDAVTFIISAGLLRAGLERRPAPRPAAMNPGESRVRQTSGRGGRHRLPSTPVLVLVRRAAADSGEALAILRSLPRARSLVLLGILCGSAAAVPEGLASPFAAEQGAGADAVGVLMASGPIGSVVGAVLIGRLLPARWRDRLIQPLALVVLVPLAVTPLLPGIVAPFVGWVVAGVGMAFLLPAGAQIVREVPSAARGRVMGLAQSGIMVGQGLFLLLGGLAGGVLGISRAIGLAGAGGLVAAVALFRVLRGNPERPPDLPESVAVVLPRPRDAPAEVSASIAAGQRV